jgi:hypothetical protein
MDEINAEIGLTQLLRGQSDGAAESDRAANEKDTKVGEHAEEV